MEREGAQLEKLIKTRHTERPASDWARARGIQVRGGVVMVPKRHTAAPKRHTAAVGVRRLELVGTAQGPELLVLGCRLLVNLSAGPIEAAPAQIVSHADTPLEPVRVLTHHGDNNAIVFRHTPERTLRGGWRFGPRNGNSGDHVIDRAPYGLTLGNPRGPASFTTAPSQGVAPCFPLALPTDDRKRGTSGLVRAASVVRSVRQVHRTPGKQFRFDQAEFPRISERTRDAAGECVGCTHSAFPRWVLAELLKCHASGVGSFAPQMPPHCTSEGEQHNAEQKHPSGFRH